MYPSTSPSVRSIKIDLIRIAKSMLVLTMSVLLSVGSGLPTPAASEPATEGASSFIDTTDRNFVNKYLPGGSYLGTNEVKPGMKGYGLSVFHGTAIEKFDFTVIGVLKKVMSGRDAILVKLSGAAMESNNVIRGMSGSPCYVNGKLIGAVSFGYDFSKEPIAGVTPIVEMLDGLAGGEEQKTPIAKAIQKGFNVPWHQSGLQNTSSGELHMSPLVSPVALAGFSPNAEKFLSKQFKDLGMMVSSGSSGGLSSSGLNPSAASQIKPGSAVSVLLTSGDFTTVATGTTTARFGNKVLAFGHPFLSAGAIEFPMATAVVHQVLPSLSVSFKIASPIAEVGSFTTDRPWSCGGQIGKASKMIPASFEVVDETRKIQRSFNCKIVDHPDLTPQLLAATTMSAVDATHQYAGPYVAKVESKLEAEGIEPLVRQDKFGSNIAPHSVLEMLMSMMGGSSVAGSVYRNASAIANNDFQKASIKSFKIRVTLEDGHKTATLDRVYVEKPFAAPGEQVKVMCVVKPYNQEARTETLSFQIPRDAPDGNLVIGVAGGDQIDYVRHRIGLSDPESENLKQIADEIRREGRGDEINLVVGLWDQTLLMNGVKIPDPPSHWAKVLFSNRHTRGPQIVKGELQSKKLTDYMLYGSHILTVEVRSQDKAAARSAPSSMPNYTGGDEPAMTDLARKTLGSSNANFSRGANNRSGQTVTILQGGLSGTVVVQQGNTQSSSSSSSKTTSSSGSIFSSAGKLYPHMRLHQIWRQETEEDFHNGKTEGTTIDSWGRIGPGLDNIDTQSISPENTIWAGVWSQGYFHFAADNKIWKWRGDSSKPELLASLNTTIVPALAADSTGTIYAAAVPGGGIYAVSPSGDAKQIYKPAESVISALCTDAQDNLYIGVSGKGKVYKLDKNRVATPVFDTGQAHVTALFYSRNDRKLYIGTAEKGSVFSVDENGKPHSIYQSPDHIVTGVARTKNGDLYVSTASQGKLVRVLPSGEPQSLASSEAFYTLFYDQDRDAVFAGDAEGDITMAAIDPVTEQPYFIPVCHTEQEAVLGLAANGKQLFAGSSNLSLLKSFNLSAAKAPSYESKVKDAGRLANWVRLRTSGPFTESDRAVNSHVRIESRTGNTSMADATWSPWSAASFDGESYLLSSPAGRFLQYKLVWTNPLDVAMAKQSGPQIGRVDVVFMPKDVAPQFSTISLKAASAVSGKQDISITSTDGDGDNMLCTIEISGDAGKTWESLTADLRPKNAKKESSSVNKETSKTESKDSKDSKSDSKDAKSDSKDSKSDSKDSKDSKDSSSKDSKNKDSKDSKSDSKDSKEKDSSKDSKDSKESKGSTDSRDSKARRSRYNGQISDKSLSLGVISQGLRIDGESIRLDEQTDNKSENKDGDSKDGDGKDKDSSSSDKDSKDDDKDKKDGESAPDRDNKKDDDKSDEKSDDKKKPKAKNARGTTVSSGSSSSTGKNSEGTSTETFSYNWDTNKRKDGPYILRFIVDDRLSNPEDHQRTINVRAVTVDNTAPEIELIECKRRGDKVECKVQAKDKQTPIVNAMFRFDEGEYFAFASTSSTSDGLNGTLIANSVPVPKGAKKIEVKVSDRAGNTAIKSSTIK